jgi:hypothetical protein
LQECDSDYNSGMSTEDKRVRMRAFDSVELRRVLALYERITGRLSTVIDDLERVEVKSAIAVDGGEKLFDVANDALGLCGKLMAEADKAVVKAERERKQVAERVTDSGPSNRKPVAKRRHAPESRSRSPS